ncbi:hypothetical protein DFP72DRAFT_233661 [Ephemerocybe angulata]|uniref:Uncharacterized protein n=1 Tax=Ephemerocybe angulata TaxID=980116 RepID=A0A8H6M9V3_9AGAR|nr:hypothetical protein DFP72DRAFT_233661 [Tulosesus angulatus]
MAQYYSARPKQQNAGDVQDSTAPSKLATRSATKEWVDNLDIGTSFIFPNPLSVPPSPHSITPSLSPVELSFSACSGTPTNLSPNFAPSPTVSDGRVDISAHAPSSPRAEEHEGWVWPNDIGTLILTPSSRPQLFKQKGLGSRRAEKRPLDPKGHYQLPRAMKPPEESRRVPSTAREPTHNRGKRGSPVTIGTSVPQAAHTDTLGTTSW